MNADKTHGKATYPKIAATIIAVPLDFQPFFPYIFFHSASHSLGPE